MSEPKFTPGPWKAVAAFENCGYYVEEGTFNNTVCDLYFVNNGRFDFKNAELNAHLIAAAPDMYEELKSAAEIFAFYAAHHLAKGDKVKYETNISHAERISKILVKARGEG